MDLHDGVPRVRARVWSLRVLAVGLAVSLAAACTPPDPGGEPNDPGPPQTSLPAPSARHGDGSVLLAWVVDGAPDGATYEWEWRRSGVATWTSATSADPQYEVTTGLTPRAFHFARVRYVDQDATPGEWSSGVKFFYADLTLPVVRIDTAGGAPVADRENYLTAARSSTRTAPAMPRTAARPRSAGVATPRGWRPRSPTG